MEKSEICKLFGCSLEQLNSQYADNAKVLKGMQAKAVKSGKKVNGYTADQLKEAANTYDNLSK